MALRKLVFSIMVFCLSMVPAMPVPAQESLFYLSHSVQDHGNKSIPGSLAHIVTQANGAPVTVVLPGPPLDPAKPVEAWYYLFRTNLTVPRNLSLMIRNGARLMTRGCVVGVHASIQAGNYQIIESGSKVRLRNAVTEAPFEWWGAHSILEGFDGLNDWSQFDSGPAIQEATRSCLYAVGSPGANYLIRSTVQIPSLVTLDGRGSKLIGTPDIIDVSTTADDNSTAPMLSINLGKGVAVQNFSVDLSGAKRFAYVFGSYDVKFKDISIREVATQRDYTFFDIHNSFHCSIEHSHITGGGPTSDNGSIGILIRSDNRPTGFPVVNNIGIYDTIVGQCWTNVLLHFNHASNNILFRNVSFLGKVFYNPGTFYGIRSTGNARIDFVNLDSVHMEAIPRAFSFENGSYTIAVKCIRFSDIAEVFNLHGTRKDKISLHSVDFWASDDVVDTLYIFKHLDAVATKINNFITETSKYKYGPMSGTGLVQQLKTTKEIY